MATMSGRSGQHHFEPSHLGLAPTKRGHILFVSSELSQHLSIPLFNHQLVPLLIPRGREFIVCDAESRTFTFNSMPRRCRCRL